MKQRPSHRQLRIKRKTQNLIGRITTWERMGISMLNVKWVPGVPKTYRG